MRAFLDTNVILYAFNRGDHRQARAKELIDGKFFASAQTLNEFANVANRKLGFSWAEIGELIERIARMAQNVAPLNNATTGSAVAVAERYRLSFYDSLIVAAALSMECDTLYSEDMHDGLVIEGRLTVRNPFI